MKGENCVVTRGMEVGGEIDDIFSLPEYKTGESTAGGGGRERGPMVTRRPNIGRSPVRIPSDSCGLFPLLSTFNQSRWAVGPNRKSKIIQPIFIRFKDASLRILL